MEWITVTRWDYMRIGRCIKRCFRTLKQRVPADRWIDVKALETWASVLFKLGQSKFGSKAKVSTLLYHHEF
jgi:hypothetical protein